MQHKNRFKFHSSMPVIGIFHSLYIFHETAICSVSHEYLRNEDLREIEDDITCTRTILYNSTIYMNAIFSDKSPFKSYHTKKKIHAVNRITGGQPLCEKTPSIVFVRAVILYWY